MVATSSSPLVEGFAATEVLLASLPFNGLDMGSHLVGCGPLLRRCGCAPRDPVQIDGFEKNLLEVFLRDC